MMSVVRLLGLGSSAPRSGVRHTALAVCGAGVRAEVWWQADSPLRRTCSV